MTLRQAIEKVAMWGETEVICARMPWSPDSEAIVVPMTEDLGVPDHVVHSGFGYLLDLPVAREVVDSLPDGLSFEEKLRILIYYAEYDAFPEPW